MYLCLMILPWSLKPFKIVESILSATVTIRKEVNNDGVVS